MLAAIAGGLSCRQAAQRFGVSASSAIRWRALECIQGDARPKALGGDRRSGRIEARAGLILALVEETPDITLEELRADSRPRPRGRLRHALAFLRAATDHAQKKTAHAAEQYRPDVLETTAGVVRRSACYLDPARLVFIDETWASTIT